MAKVEDRESPGNESLLSGERHVLELLATDHTLADVLEALCRLIDEHSGLISAVYVLDRDSRHLTFAAGPGVPPSWRDATKSFAALATMGTCGAAIHSRRQVTVVDLQTSPLYSAEWRAHARAAGIVSVWSTPLFASTGPALGTFAMASARPAGPDPAQLELVERAAHLAAIAIERHQAIEGLMESERRFSTSFYSSPGIMTITRAGDGHFLHVNDRFVSTFGYSRQEAVGRTALELGLWVHPSDRDVMQQQLREVGVATEFEAKARTKSGTIIDVLVWMSRIQLLGEDCVLGITCDISERKRVEARLAESEHLLRVVLDALPVGVAVTNDKGDIVLSNPASKRIWGLQLLIGRERYERSQGWWHETGQPVSPREWASSRALTRGESSINEVIDIEAFDGVRKTIHNSAVPLRDGDDHITGSVIVNEDVTARTTAEHDLNESLVRLRRLTASVMRAQDDERRRIAQVLHETTAQDLAALKMQLARLARTDDGLTAEGRAMLVDSIELAERSMTGIRTLSYLMYPPFLDEAGLLSAVRWYAAGFSERSGILVDLKLPPALDRLSQEAETTLFRVVQESLINVHRHANSLTAAIKLTVTDGRLVLEIEDRGRGVAPQVLEQFASGGGGGVGLASMRERLQQLGGTLSIESSAAGTLVRAELPFVTRDA